jgi:hypothetical protein
MITAIQILLTVLVTGGFVILSMTYVTIDKKSVKLKNWYDVTTRLLLLIHAFALPAAIINLIWSY